MIWLALAGGAILLAALAAFLYWQLNLAEGVYLGRRVVVWLYDRFAPRYDTVKQFDDQDEAWFVGAPLTLALQSVTTALVLDVATGTARLPLALFQQPSFAGRVIALDLSRQMLRHAAVKTAAHRDRLTLLWTDATHLPFPDEVFDAVTCLEALEFLPDARTTLAEMVRVLRPTGVFLVSNRIGPGVRWIPGRTMNRESLTALFESLSLSDVRINVWQVDYDLVWARKRATDPTARPVCSPSGAPSTLPFLLCCPRCGSTPLTREDTSFECGACGGRYPIAKDGVVELGS
jgi:SAM-dependent methyltransferase